MYLKMRNGNLALEELASDEITSGGIYIPNTVSRKGNLKLGKVIEVGPGELIQGQFVKMDIEKGQKVVFDSSRTEIIELDNRKLTICNMIDVIATISEKHLSIVPPKSI